MRKMTKVAVTLAAMSAMTVASASMAFAATKVSTLEGLSSENGAWSQDANKKWSYKNDGTELKNTWAQIDGVWYYFDGNKKMAQADFVEIEGNQYYFNEDGSMMANGWKKITSNTDAYDKIEISEQLMYSKANAYVGESYAYDYLDYVWCYFNADGTAKVNEWFQADSGLWYYFDGNVMVMNIMNYIIDPDNHDFADSASYQLYGFDENGAMLTGWNDLERDDDGWNDPTRDDGGKTYYYYHSNGQMQQVGWAKIDNEWYLFADTTTDKYNTGLGTVDGDDRYEAKAYGFPLIVNSYIMSDRNKDKVECFYVDDKGKMKTGVATVSDKAWKVTFYQDTNKQVVVDYENMYDTVEKVGTKTEAYFGKKGATIEDFINGRFYTGKIDHLKGVEDSRTFVVNKTDVDRVSSSVYDYSEALKSGDVYAVTGGAGLVTTGFAIENGTHFTGTADINAQLVKSAIIGVKGVRVADADGDLITNKVIMIDNAARIAKVDGNGDYVLPKDDRNVDIKVAATADEIADELYIEDAEGNKWAIDYYDNAYIIMDGEGKAYDQYTGKTRSFTIGGITYWATDVDFVVNDQTATVFVSNKQVNKQD